MSFFKDLISLTEENFIRKFEYFLIINLKKGLREIYEGKTVEYMKYIKI